MPAITLESVEGTDPPQFLGVTPNVASSHRPWAVRQKMCLSVSVSVYD